MPFMPFNSENNTSETDSLNILISELEKGLSDYLVTAGEILGESCVSLKKNEGSFFSMEKNFFSLLFLFSFFRGNIPEERRILYVTVNQCLRGMVTGCDNILDDEYKVTLDTDLPQKAYRFRSILDIMVSDRVLFTVLSKGAEKGLFDRKLIQPAISASLSSLLESGAQEATEEEGVKEFLLPDEVLKKVHHFKTGILFQSPWAVPFVIEGKKSRFEEINSSLYDIGMGCQILDDMVDLALDINTKRHNYAASVIYHGENRKKLSEDIRKNSINTEDREYLKKYSSECLKLTEKAEAFLNKGFDVLFGERYKNLKGFSIDFIKKQIGADRFSDGKQD